MILILLTYLFKVVSMMSIDPFTISAAVVAVVMTVTIGMLMHMSKPE